MLETSKSNIYEVELSDINRLFVFQARQGRRVEDRDVQVFAGIVS